MRVKEIRIENPSDIGETAYRIAEGIAQEVSGTAKDGREDRWPVVATEVDDITRAEYDAIGESEQFIAFRDRLIDLLNQAAGLVEEYRLKYNCSLFAGVTFLNSNVAMATSSLALGKHDSIVDGLCRQMVNSTSTKEILEDVFLLNLISRQSHDTTEHHT